MIEAQTRRRLYTFPLHRRDSIGSAYHVLTFEANEPIAALPGQFAMVRSTTWGDAPLLPRPMSLLTGGTRPSILIKVVGEGTMRMAYASSGEQFELLAPLGRPWSPLPEGHRAVFVAGGVGVAPLVFLAQALGEARAGGEMPLALYGGRTHADLPLDAELAAVTELRVATEDGSRGTHGRVTVLLEKALDELSGRAIKVYTCGPDPMMAAVARICAERHVACEVSLETPMACGYGVCLGCPVPRRPAGYLYACTEGPCIDAALIDWERGHGVSAGQKARGAS
ncbi:dihydroorotate dehydrogenase electron transfer subunit [Polyangium aurulentum]|uniref:dihydroorotate dehydrogenase electron transfer subunit n=1 Tax=Polyangium aurulentum TaxID=2567896 RepID=UPI0010AE172D|nr:dihydroorotate dehydrogenase electron transfer subunit [Polyangium aurulentum]UQA62315.1 dihydroorotate dehydrogenase electron transfer subunit [Polyangium aurulentum]